MHMKLTARWSGIGFCGILLVLAFSLLSVSARAAFLYKSYIVKRAENQDILCDSYIVQKDDYVLKIFRQRGEISNTDFPDFLKIFKTINPQVQNIDKILPGQQIFIPLKKLAPESVPDQDFGVVTIPFVTSTEIDDILKEHSDEYEVKRGDTVSELLTAHFGRYGTEAYNEGLSIFKAMNPQIENVNLILVGQQLWVPKKSLQNELWYESLFDANGNVVQSRPAEAAENKENKTSGEETATTVAAETNAPLTEAARILDAKLYRKGTYYFPRPGRSDLQLDLTAFPILETGDGARVLITTPGGKKRLTDEGLSVLKSYWKNLVVAQLPENASLSQILDSVVGSLVGGTISGKRVYDDDGIQVSIQSRWMLDQPNRDGILSISTVKGDSEKLSRSMVDYLKKFRVVIKEVVLSDTSGASATVPEPSVSYGQIPALDVSMDRKTFVRNLLGVLGVTFQQNVTVSFAYAGIQIQAVTNALNRSDGLLVLVDFGDLQGDAVKTIEKAGFQIIQVPTTGDVKAFIPELLNAAGIICEKTPSFSAARWSGSDNITITLPGFLAKKDKSSQVLLATIPVPDDLARFFIKKGIDVVILSNLTSG